MKKSPSSLLRCFPALHSVASETANELAVDRRRSMTSWWSRFRAKKRTMPLDQSEISEIEAEDENNNMNMPVKVVQSTKMSCFERIFHKKQKCNFQKKPSNNIANITNNGQHQTRTCRVLSKCKAQTEPAASLHFEPCPVQTETDMIVQPTVSATRNHRTQKRKKKNKTSEEGSVRGLTALAMTLAMVLLGGRLVAIACMSAWFYVMPYLSSTRIVNYSDKKTDLAQMEITCSLENHRKVVLQGLLERNGRRV